MAASYLANLGAKLQKQLQSVQLQRRVTQSQSVSEVQVPLLQQPLKHPDVYGSDIGPLIGLFVTTDDRLQTINLIGSKILYYLQRVF